MTKPVRTFVLLFLLALAVRLGVGLRIGMSREPVEDERGYLELTRTFRQQRIILLSRSVCVRFAGGYYDLDVSRTAFRGPIAPVMFAPFLPSLESYGTDVMDSRARRGQDAAPLRLLSILLGALGPPLLFLALRKSSLVDRAWWPAAAYALWPPAIYVSVRALSEAPSQALLLGAVAALVAPRTRGGIAGGALAALAVLARPAALIPAALLVFATGTRRRAIGFVVAFMAVLAPWEIRNWNLHGRPLLTTNTGVTLVGGNSQAAADAEHPGKWVPPDRVYEGADDPPDLGMWGWSELTEEASDRRFTADALRWVGENPGDAALLAFWKVVRLFDPDQHSEKPDAGTKAIVGWLTVAPVLLLAILGARRGEIGWWMLIVGTVATAVVFYGDTRMRTCAEPALLVLAAHGVTSVARRLRGETVD